MCQLRSVEHAPIFVPSRVTVGLAKREIQIFSNCEYGKADLKHDLERIKFAISRFFAQSFVYLFRTIVLQMTQRLNILTSARVIILLHYILYQLCHYTLLYAQLGIDDALPILSDVTMNSRAEFNVEGS